MGGWAFLFMYLEKVKKEMKEEEEEEEEKKIPSQHSLMIYAIFTNLA